MSLIALGINHHTAPVSVRERAAINDARLGDALKALRGLDAVNEATIVSTCNRTEIYCGMHEPDTGPLLDWMQQTLDWPTTEFLPYLFQLVDREAVHHLMRVCSGLDSMVLGEPQILGQIKQAYRDASTEGTIGTELGRLFESAFQVAKLVRTDTAIGSSPVSVAFAAVSLARQVFSDLGQQTALLVGAGDTIQLAARHLRSQGIGRTLIANRTVERAQALATECGGEAFGLGALPQHLANADIIIASTGSQLPILGKGAVEQALKARRYRPMLIVDIAVPRDVETEVGQLDNVFLYSVDDLHDVITENIQSRRAAAEQAEEIINNHVDAYMRQLRAASAADTIKAYRRSVDAIREEALVKAQRQLLAGQDPRDVMQQLAHQLGNKLMHGPSVQLREAAERGDQTVIKAAHTLFGLPDPD